VLGDASEPLLNGRHVDYDPDEGIVRLNNCFLGGVLTPGGPVGMLRDGEFKPLTLKELEERAALVLGARPGPEKPMSSASSWGDQSPSIPDRPVESPDYHIPPHTTQHNMEDSLSSGYVAGLSSRPSLSDSPWTTYGRSVASNQPRSPLPQFSRSSTPNSPDNSHDSR
jgi:hypothetical protein